MNIFSISIFVDLLYNHIDDADDMRNLMLVSKNNVFKNQEWFPIWKIKMTGAYYDASIFKKVLYYEIMDRSENKRKNEKIANEHVLNVFLINNHLKLQKYFKISKEDVEKLYFKFTDNMSTFKYIVDKYGVLPFDKIRRINKFYEKIDIVKYVCDNYKIYFSDITDILRKIRSVEIFRLFHNKLEFTKDDIVSSNRSQCSILTSIVSSNFIDVLKYCHTEFNLSSQDYSRMIDELYDFEDHVDCFIFIVHNNSFTREYVNKIVFLNFSAFNNIELFKIMKNKDLIVKSDVLKNFTHIHDIDFLEYVYNSEKLSKNDIGKFVNKTEEMEYKFELLSRFKLTKKNFNFQKLITELCSINYLEKVQYTYDIYGISSQETMGIIKYFANYKYAMNESIQFIIKQNNMSPKKIRLLIYFNRETHHHQDYYNINLDEYMKYLLI